VRRHRDDLKEYADLRNAIVHERSDGRPIAEPHDRSVAELQRLAAVISNPPQVLPAFQKKVHTVDGSARISEALSFFFPKNYSQVPVTSDRGIVGLLTTNTVSRWLAAQADRELVDLTEHSVLDALKHTEHDGNWQIVPRSTLLADIVEAFDNMEAHGKRLDAVLVTNSGKPTETLLGIITIHDMPKALRKLTSGSQVGAA
jgi:CBS domain-containing protein